MLFFLFYHWLKHYFSCLRSSSLEVLPLESRSWTLIISYSGNLFWIYLLFNMPSYQNIFIASQKFIGYFLQEVLHLQIKRGKLARMKSLHSSYVKKPKHFQCGESKLCCCIAPSFLICFLDWFILALIKRVYFKIHLGQWLKLKLFWPGLFKNGTGISFTPSKALC